MRRRQYDISGLEFSVWTSTWGWTPLPPSTCVHMSLTPSRLCVDVINGWPLFLNVTCFWSLQGRVARKCNISALKHALVLLQSSREQLAIAEFASSLLVIPKQLAVNAAKDSTDLVAKLRAFHNSSQTKPEHKELRW